MAKDVSGSTGIVMMLVVIAFVTLMDGLDGSIVNVALPTMAKDFGTDTGTIAWVNLTYLIMLAGLLIVFARISKNGMIKKMLLGGFILFTISSLFCGLSASFEMLLVFRVLQGIGAAMMGAAAPIVCVKYLPGKLGLGMGVITVGWSLGFALGPGIGGIITDLISWHWIFFINVPLGIVILPLIMKAIPKDDEYSGSIDITGAALLFSAVALGIFAVVRSPYSEELFLVTIAAIACVIFLAAFIAAELKREDPLLNLRVFKHWKFNAVLMGYMGGNLVYMGMLFLLPFYMSVCMAFSTTQIGLYILISPLITLLICVPISRWSDRTERRAFAVASCAFMTIGCLVMALFAADSMILPLVVTLVCMGLMWGIAGGPMASRIIENVEDESREMGSSVMTEFIYLGATLGTALFAMLFTFGSGAGNINFEDVPPELFIDGFVLAAIVGTVLAAITLVLSFIVKEPKTER